VACPPALLMPTTALPAPLFGLGASLCFVGLTGGVTETVVQGHNRLSLDPAGKEEVSVTRFVCYLDVAWRILISPCLEAIKHDPPRRQVKTRPPPQPKRGRALPYVGKRTECTIRQPNETARTPRPLSLPPTTSPLIQHPP
jgi:hypothetical protein